MTKCNHERLDVSWHILSKGARFRAHVSVQCEQCNLPFRFLGLPVGFNENGATISPDGCEVQLAIAPKDDPTPYPEMKLWSVSPELEAQEGQCYQMIVASSTIEFAETEAKEHLPEWRGTKLTIELLGSAIAETKPGVITASRNSDL